MNEEMKDALKFINDRNEDGLLRSSSYEGAYECFKYHGETIRKALEAQNSITRGSGDVFKDIGVTRPVVDVEPIAKSVYAALDDDDIIAGKTIEGLQDILIITQELINQGLIGGVPDGFALVPVTMPDTFDNWMCDALYRQAVYSNDIKSQDVWSAVIKAAQE